MTFKDTVKINGIKPECILGLIICENVYKEYGQDMVITSITDSKHTWGSLHYAGFAFDLRSREFMIDDLERIRSKLDNALTYEFDVVLERDHFHVEFQPKD